MSTRVERRYISHLLVYRLDTVNVPGSQPSGIFWFLVELKGKTVS